ncbi:MAG TPA: universal stress protein [Candidatus Binataceae bacterium]|nr:universal stress protein [Candidatus Binataceae bacterium]
MIFPCRSILSPIELDDPSLVALRTAEQIAANQGSTIHLLHVVPRLPAFGEPDVVEDEHSVAEQQARSRLKEIARLHLSGVNYQIHTAAASARSMAKAVVRVAKEVNADLIVLKTSGRKGLSNFILGNVSEEVVRTAPCPVLTLAPAAQEKAAHAGLREAQA